MQKRIIIYKWLCLLLIFRSIGQFNSVFYGDYIGKDLISILHMLVNEISMASSVVPIDSAWIERKRLLISLMKNKSVYQIQVKSGL